LRFCQAVPWSEPSSRNFHGAPALTSMGVGGGWEEGAKVKSSIVWPVRVMNLKLIEASPPSISMAP
jgi:hypothetical protein